MSQGRSTPCIGPLMTGILIVGPYKPLRNWFDEFIPYYIYIYGNNGSLDPSTYDYPTKYIEILPQRGKFSFATGAQRICRTIKSSTTVDDFLSKGRFQNLNLRSKIKGISRYS